MEEDEILAFRNRAGAYLEKVLLSEGYDVTRACELSFFIAKVLEDVLPLLEDIDKNNSDADSVLDHIHMLYANVSAFNEGHKVLMYRD